MIKLKRISIFIPLFLSLFFINHAFGDVKTDIYPTLKRPQLVLESSSFNFGKVSKRQGSKVKVFKLYNKGNSDLIITNIRVSCSCVTASLKVDTNKSPYFGIVGAGPGWQVVIEPDSSGELEVVADLAHPSMGIGRQMRDIFVASNDPVYPETSIRIEVDVTD